jgi:hypothetical protein
MHSRKSFRLSAVALSVSALLAACGGNDDEVAVVPASPSLQLTGVAATGLALADSAVDVKCAAGTGTATTSEAGAYEVNIANGALPCVVKVTGEADGAPVTLHSVAEAGTTSGSNTAATANVTPLTEMVVAQLAGGLPSSFFDGFSAESAVTGEQLAAATSSVLVALGTAVGQDLSAIDPFKGELVPATATSAGNAYDDALEAIKAKIPLAVLPQVVNQIGSTAAAPAGSGTALVTLDEVLTSAAAGSLAGCPAALSGKYRVVDFRGETNLVELDFGRNKAIAGDEELDITPSELSCEFTVADGNGTTVAFGPSGVAILSDDNTTAFVFPVQSLKFSDIQGEWRFVESGLEEEGAPIHWAGKVDFGADQTVTACEYDVEGGITDVCTTDEDVSAAKEAEDGGVVVTWADGGGSTAIYGYRTPSGTLTLFGTSNPTGADDDGVLQTHVVAFKPVPVVMPEQGSVRKFREALMFKSPSGSLNSVAMTSSSGTITAVDSVAGSYTRVQDDTGVTNVFSINQPLPGMVERQNRSPVYAFILPGTAISLAINAPGNPNFIYSMTVTR